MKSLWFILYNLLIFPFLISVSIFISLFNRKMSIGLAGKKKSFADIRKFNLKRSENSKLILFHCASLGEYEQIKPILRLLSDDYSSIQKVVSFFSPSGYKNAGLNSDVDLKIYLPVDSLSSINKFLNLLKPGLLVVSKHDIWPNLIWSLFNRKIVTILINGTMPVDSIMTKPIVRHFYRTIFSCLSFIAPASQADSVGFQKIVKHNVPMEILGDTRFDQVLIRSLETRKKQFLPRNFFGDHQTIVAGSIWPSDEEQLFLPFVELLRSVPDLFLILVPHEPDNQHIRRIKAWFQDFGFQSFYFSEGRFQDNLKRHRILIVDRIGILANLYGYGDIAYVGGSFGPGVHNVMEPAAFQLPVLFGPKILNSPEALELVSRKAGFQVENKAEMLRKLKKLCQDPDYKKAAGSRSFAFVEENKGSTEKIVKRILDFLT